MQQSSAETKIEDKPEAKVEFDFYLLTGLTHTLVEILLQEGDLLKAFKVSEITNFQAQKHEIAIQLEAQQKALNEDPSIKNQFTAEQIQQLRKLAKEYEDAISYYQAQLFKAQKVNEVTVKMIIDTVTEYANRNRGYNHLYGSKKLNGNMHRPVTPAMKLNKNV